MGETENVRPKRRAQGQGPSSAVLTPPTGIPSVESAIPVEAPQPDAPAERRIDTGAFRAIVVPDDVSGLVRAPQPPDQAAPPAAPVSQKVCVCGHEPEAHEHYRPGHDCGACGPAVCASYRPLHPEQGRRKGWFRRR